MRDVLLTGQTDRRRTGASEPLGGHGAFAARSDRPGPLRVGPELTIFPPVLQAPMSAITTLPMRTLAESQGCGLTITEWLPATGVAARGKVLDKLAPSRGGRPFGVQIFGRDPEAMRAAAAIAVERGAALVDVNMGCPGKKVRSGSCGAALMRDPPLACELVAAVREGVARRAPLSVKMRAGWDEQHKNAPELAAQVVAAGAQMVTVHGRTRQQRYGGAADLAIIRAVRDAIAGVPLIANGDIVDIASMQRAFAETRADGVMIGRAATGNPWIFAQLASWWSDGPPPAPPSPAERIATYLHHLSLYLETTGERRAVIEMRKFAAFYLAPVPDGEALRRRINRTDRLADIERLLEDYRAAHAARCPGDISRYRTAESGAGDRRAPRPSCR